MKNIQRALIRKLFTISLLAILFGGTRVFAVDMEVGLQWDTFSSEKEKGIIGFSFVLSEKLSKNVRMFADIENLYALNYNASAGVEIAGNYFMIAPSFLFTLRSGVIAPGVSIDSMVNIGKTLSLAIYSDFAFSPSDFSSNSLIDLEGAVIFHTKNSEITVSYEYNHIFKTDGYDNTNSAKIDVLAFEYGFPFKIDIFFGAGGYKRSYDESYFDLDVDVGGMLIFDFEKAGRYTLKGESEVFRMLRTSEEKIPFAISLSVGFTIE